MRIGCLQFAPQVGDIDNNLNRADSVLNKANPDDLESLDLLVLPELAFTGYNFKSLQEISQFLEPSGSGISSLWARTTALKYNTTVVVGYPEKVDVAIRWPTSPEYYNSAIVVNGDGETIANYRKSFLYMVDETWALEGKDFFGGYLEGLGDTAIGICMDINPYKFEAPWHAFEFAFHVMEMQANLVIITMAWLTREDGRMYSRTPAEPDMDTLTYWVQRFEPLIRAETEDEIIVVFCNRTGTEGEVVYAGTSAVIGIKDGEVKVYGLLGRGVKDLLVVDTDVSPIAKLVHRPDGEGLRADSLKAESKSPSSQDKAPRPPKREEVKKPPRSPSENGTSTTKEANARSRKVKPPSPRITIPERRKYTTTTGGLIEESPTVPTPTAPSPTPLSLRPKVTLSEDQPAKAHVETPYRHDASTREHLTPDDMRVYGYGGNVHVRSEHVTPISDNSERLSEKYFFIPSHTMIQTPRDPWARFLPVSPTATSAALVRFSGCEPGAKKESPEAKRTSSPKSEFSSGSSIQSSRSGRSHTSKAGDRVIAVPESTKEEDHGAPRPASPKSRNASRTGRPLDRRTSVVEQPDITGMVQKLEALARRPGSSMDRRDPEPYHHERPASPKSRNASRTGRPVHADQALDERLFNISRTSIPIAASPGVLAGAIDRPSSDILRNFTSRMNQRNPSLGDARPSSRGGQHSSPMAEPNMDQSHPRSASAAPQLDEDGPTAHIEPDETRTLIWSEISKLVGEVLERPDSRSVSRGRRPAADRSPSTESTSVRPTRSESRGLPNDPRAKRRFASRDGRGLGGNVIANQPQVSQQQFSNAQLNGLPGSAAPYNPDEIVAEIIFHASGCPTHSHTHQNTPVQSNVGTPNQAGNQPAHQRNISHPRQMSNPRFPKRMNSSSSKTGTPPSQHRPMTGEQPLDSNEMEINIFKAPTPLVTKGRGESTDSCPTMSGASIHTINSPNGSPATPPPPRVFEPTTPKAMKLEPELGTLLSAGSDPTGSGNFESLQTLSSELIAEMALDRPKSAVW